MFRILVSILAKKKKRKKKKERLRINKIEFSLGTGILDTLSTKN